MPGRPIVKEYDMSGGVTAVEIRSWCINHIATMLRGRAADIDPNASFARLGLDSATMINLIVAAEEWLGIEVEPDTVYEYRSVNALSEYLAALIDRRLTLSGKSAGDASL
jgi:acyl carrier protein